MVSSPQPWFAQIVRLGKLLALVLALASQIGAGASAFPRETPESPAVALHAAMVLCVGGTHPGKGGLPPVHHHVPGPTLAATSHHVVQHFGVLGSDIAVPPPVAIRAFWTGFFQAQAPPVRFAVACYPTGPPSHLI